MPRKSDERGFGFRSTGILRILLAADAEQVLIAVEQLGFRLPDRAPFDSLTELVIQVHETTEQVIAEFFADLIKQLEFAIFELEEDPAPGEAEAARALRQLLARREAFLLDLQRKRNIITAELSSVGDQFPFNLPEF